MAECSICGKNEMTFTCRYCDEKFCSEHRLPENHDCDSLDDAQSRSGSSSDKWFEQKDAGAEKVRGRSRQVQNSLLEDVRRTLTNSVTLSIIVLTTFSFFLQQIVGYTDLMNLSPALTQAAVEATNSVGFGQVLTSTLVEKPWSLLTVMIVHGGTFHLFANMVTFYFFGTTLEKRIEPKSILKFYVASGLVASLAFVAFRNFLYTVHGPAIGAAPTLINAVGASGAVVAIFAAVAMIYPNAEVLLYFFIPMKIKTAMYLFASVEALNLLTTAAGMPLPVIGNFASSAHLAGLACGLWYGRKLRHRFRNQVGTLDLFEH